MALSATDQRAADLVVTAAQPALTFITRWLPLFYVAPLVVVPLAVDSMPADELEFHCTLLYGELRA